MEMGKERTLKIQPYGPGVKWLVETIQGPDAGVAPRLEQISAAGWRIFQIAYDSASAATIVYAWRQVES